MQSRKKIAYIYELNASGETIASLEILDLIKKKLIVQPFSYNSLNDSSLLGYFIWLINSISQTVHFLKRKNYDIIYTTSYIAIISKLLLLKKNKVVFHYHGNRVLFFDPIFNPINFISRLFKLIVSYSLNRIALSQAQYILCPSSHTKNQIIKTFFIHYCKIVVVANGVKSTNRSKKISLHKNNIILSAGSMNSQKNFERVIDVFSKIKNPKKRLHICYHNNNFQKSYFTKLRNKIKLMNLSKKVSFLNNANMDQEYSKASLVISFSLQETFQLIMLEALSYGKPFFTTHPSSNDILNLLSINAFIPSTSSDDMIAHQIENYLNLNNKDKKEIASELINIAENQTWEKTANKILEFL